MVSVAPWWAKTYYTNSIDLSNLKYLMLISCYIILYHVISCYIMLYHVISLVQTHLYTDDRPQALTRTSQRQGAGSCHPHRTSWGRTASRSIPRGRKPPERLKMTMYSGFTQLTWWCSIMFNSYVRLPWGSGLWPTDQPKIGSPNPKIEFGYLLATVQRC